MQNGIVRVEDLRQQVYNHLKEMIKNGKFRPDKKFYEIGLAKELGVSRTPVREALAMLVRDGLLENRGRGLQFPQFSPEEITNIIEIRTILEPFAIGKIISQNDVQSLSEMADEMRKKLNASGSGEKYLATHRELRDLLFSKLKNLELASAIGRYEDSIQYLRVLTFKDPSLRIVSYELMQCLIDAIAIRDIAQSREIILRQLTTARDSYLNAISGKCEKRK